jgi:hypothetical protein
VTFPVLHIDYTVIHEGLASSAKHAPREADAGVQEGENRALRLRVVTPSEWGLPVFDSRPGGQLTG